MATVKKRKEDPADNCSEQACPATSCYQPKTLFDFCINFVAAHVQYIDSLEDFPDVIGHKIFTQAVNSGAFSLQSEKAPQNMNLFHSAYTHNILETLNLRKSHLAIGLYQEHFEVFTALTQLDLGQCKLGDDHDLLLFVSHMERLEVLHLDDNVLSDRGLQKLTIPMNVKRRGPLKLKVLNLSCNPDITSQSIKYLLRFKNLHLLDLSGTAVQSRAIAIGEMKRVQHGAKLKHCPPVQTSGWAADVIEGWKKEIQEKTRPSIKQSSATGKFYSRKSIRMDMAKCDTNDATPARTPVIIYERLGDSGTSKNQCSLDAFAGEKRPLMSKKKSMDKRPLLQCNQNSKSPGETNEDSVDPLLRSYLNTNRTSCKLKSKDTLWSAMNSDHW